MLTTQTLVLPISRSLLVLAVLAGLQSGCDSTGTMQITGDESGLMMPAVITESRAIDTSTIWPTIALGDSTPVRMTQDGDSWTAALSAPPNTSQLVTIVWMTEHMEQELPLARIQRTLPVGATGFELNIAASASYSTDFDSDDDDITNLAELDNNTDPFTPDNPLAGVDVLIPRVNSSAAPFVDGLGAAYSPTNVQLVGEWASSAQTDRSNRTLYIDKLMINVDNDQASGEPFHRWAAVHDGTYLYVLVLVDDIGEHHSDSTGLEHDDSLELYIDGNNSKNEDYFESDDFYVQIALLEFQSSDANSSIFGGGRFKKGFFSAALPDGIQFATGPSSGPASIRGSTNRQDVYEVRINIADFGITLGERFGIEVQINDDDNGDERDGKWGWIHPALGNGNVVDATWRNPSLMGTAILQP